MSLVIAIDYDGTLVESADAKKFRPGAVDAVKAMAAAGHRLVLHSCRGTVYDQAPRLDDEVARFYATGEVAERIISQWERFREMRGVLMGAGLWALFELIWQAPGKPVADVYVDDKAESPTWAQLMADFGKGKDG